MGCMDCLEECMVSLKKYVCYRYCRFCMMKYPKKWYIPQSNQCFFCYHFHSVHHTKAYMLKRIVYHYDASGNANKTRFYEEYLDLLHTWCDFYGVENTMESIELERALEEEIMSLKFPST